MFSVRKNIFYWMILVPSVFSCRYKDGPVISFHSVKKRILGTWDIESLFVNGVDLTQDVRNQSCYSPLVFTEVQDRGDILLHDHIASCPFQGSWVLLNHKRILSLSIIYSSGFNPVGAYGNGHHEWTIFKLTQKKMWLEVDDSSGDNVLKLRRI
jgi:hypothetical protein